MLSHLAVWFGLLVGKILASLLKKIGAAGDSFVIAVWVDGGNEAPS